MKSDKQVKKVLGRPKKALVETGSTKQASNKPNRINVAKAFKLRLEHNLTYQQIADMQGVTKAAVYERLQPLLKFVESPDIIQAYRSDKASIAESVQFTYLEALLDVERIKKASANNMAYVIQVLDNIIRLDRDKPTSNIAIHAIIAQIKGKNLENAETLSQ